MTSYPMSAKVAIVVGGGGSLGHATAVTLAARGLTVVAVDRNEQALRELPDSIVREAADTTDPAAVPRHTFAARIRLLWAGHRAGLEQRAHGQRTR
jgi:NAD(P)-dependent dehydrogenase (short-subunit alcohol dehydrogenase family)